MNQRKSFSQRAGDRFGQMYVWGKTSFTSLRLSLVARKRLKKIGGGYAITDQEFAEVKKYWKKYGVSPKKYWYRLYADHTHAVDPRYISDTIWFKKILPYFNNLLFMRAYTDKGMLDRLLPQARHARVVVKNMGGTFYTGDDRLITQQEAIDLCAGYDHLIFKPSIDSGAGQMIHFYDKKEMDESTIPKYFKLFFSNFVVQEIVAQHADLARIHGKSLNTIRAISFFYKGKVHILSAQLRMGAGDARIDNYTAGGIACSIKEDGWLVDEALTKQYTWTDRHPSGIPFNTIRVPAYSEIVGEIKRLHPMLPYFNIIGWDFAVDESGTPVLIEFNVTPAQNETGSDRPSFGDMTDEVLEEVFVTRSLAGRFS